MTNTHCVDLAGLLFESNQHSTLPSPLVWSLDVLREIGCRC